MESLRDMDMLKALEDAVMRKKVLFLGICVGMQILFEHSEEENTDCLGWLKGRVVKFNAAKVRVPQMGWNQVNFIKSTPCNTQSDFYYFVNSYHAIADNESDVWGITEYNGLFTSAICSGNIYATQFHAEKSGEAGLELLNNFLKLTS